MSTYREDSGETVIDGTTEVVVVPSPVGFTPVQRTVTSLRIRNRDSSAITVTTELYQEDPYGVLTWTLHSVEIPASASAVLGPYRLRPGVDLRAYLAADLTDPDVYALVFAHWSDYS